MHSLIEDKASGPDLLYPWLLKMFETEIALILTDIFYTSMREGRLPKLWREANVCCIFKKGDKGNPENYRPISLTCVTRHFVDYGIPVDSQHRFRTRQSTKTQLLATVHDMAYALQCNNSLSLATLDFAKAFDKVPQVFSSLANYVGRNISNSWSKVLIRS